MSDSVRPQRRQPPKLPRPWDSPGKNNGVGCHFLLQCMKGKRESEVAQLCPTPSDPMDCSPPGASIHWIFQARVLEWGAIAFSGSKLYRDLMQLNIKRKKKRKGKVGIGSMRTFFHRRHTDGREARGKGPCELPVGTADWCGHYRKQYGDS